MFFNIYEHYDDNQPIVKEYHDECFICFEYKTYNENIPTTLQKQKIYLNNCTCNGSIHNYCLKIWFNKNKSCPICRIHAIENNNATFFLNYIPYSISIYIFIKKLFVKFIKLFSTILFFYALIDFYLIQIRTKYILYNDYTYVPIRILGNDYIEYFNESNKIN